MHRIDTAPFYATREMAEALATSGGLQVNEFSQVLNTANQPIEGLYGAGDMVTGSFYGEPTSNAGGTVFGSMTTGLLAGDSAAAYVKGVC